MMTRTLYRIFFCLATAAIITTANGQNRNKNRRNTPAPVFVEPRFNTIDSLISEYRFSDAKTIIEEDTEQAKDNIEATNKLLALTEKATLGENMLNATEKIIVIDSLVADKEQILNFLNFDNNCGKIITSQQIKDKLNLKQTPHGLGFINGFEDHIIFCRAGKGGKVSLVESFLYGNNWSQPSELAGLDDGEGIQGFPFLMTDGTTLYFASKTTTSLGGYDIYSTRFNSDTKSYLKPQNVGMPFNSLYNDYLMAYDEVNQLGWFVSDRRQPNGKVCIYIFIPSQTRQTLNNTDDVRNKALLISIKDTQKGHEKDVANALQRLHNINKKENDNKNNYTLCIDISYGVRYTDLNQFKNKEARSLASELIVEKNKLTQLNKLLNENRKKYGECKTEAERKALSPMILRQEKELDLKNLQVKDLENKIRSLENKQN